MLARRRSATDVHARRTLSFHRVYNPTSKQGSIHEKCDPRREAVVREVEGDFFVVPKFSQLQFEWIPDALSIFAKLVLVFLTFEEK